MNNNIYMVQFNTRLKELLDERCMTADALGKSIGLSGSIIARWLRRNSSIQYANLLNTAKFFNCSLDYLCGRTEEYGQFPKREVAAFSSRIKELIKHSGKSLNAVCKETKLAHSSFYAWFQNVLPKSASLIILADYFDCAVDYLAGRE